MDIDGLPEDAPELKLSALLDQYRELREERRKHATKRTQAAAGLLITGLQVLMRKTETIKQELGSLSQVIDAQLAQTLRDGIRCQSIARLERDILGVSHLSHTR